MQQKNASQSVGTSCSEVGVAAPRLAWSRGSGWKRVRRHVRATTAHPRLSEMVLVGITCVLVAMLLATVWHALEASPLLQVQTATSSR
jgi:hypothetical protein